jgi:hypothetical protein
MICPMRHSGRTFRPPGPAFPPGLLPDLWGFGVSAEPPSVAPAVHRDRIRTLRVVQAPPPQPAPERGTDPLARLIEQIGRLFG